MRQALWAIPLHTSWRVGKNGGELELEYRHREQKDCHRYQDYDLSLRLAPEGTGYRLTLTAFPQRREPRLLESLERESREEAVPALARLQGMSAPECWRPEHRAWIAALWEAERVRLGTRRFRQLNPPRPPIPGDFVPLRIPAGWSAAWNTFDSDYLQPGFLAAADGSPLHWERDIAMFTREEEEAPVLLDLEDWSNEDCETAAFRVHLYRWRGEGPETLEEWMTASPQEAIRCLEECLARFREN